jgi:hypothetical protein
MNYKLSSEEANFLQNFLLLTEDLEELENVRLGLKEEFAKLRNGVGEALSLHYKAISNETYDFSEES